METPERSVKWLQIEELAERIKELNKKYENLIEGKQNAKRLVLNGFRKVLKDSHVHTMGMRVAKQTGWVTKFNSIPTDNSDLERWKNRFLVFRLSTRSGNALHRDSLYTLPMKNIEMLPLLGRGNYI